MLLGRYSSFVEALFNLYDRADANAVDAREVCACRLAHAHAYYVWHGQTVTRVVACRPPWLSQVAAGLSVFCGVGTQTVSERLVQAFALFDLSGDG